MSTAKQKRLDPYCILGVDRHADGDAIKSAYRRRAKDTHPDHGGDRAEFEAVARANVILSDPAKRAKFDATGEIDDDIADVADVAAFNLISQVISQAIAQEGDPCKVDLMAALKAHFIKAGGEIGQKIAALNRAKTRAQKMQGRFKRRKGEGENVLGRMMTWQLRSLDDAIRGLSQVQTNHERALAILSEYDFERDPPEQMVQMFGSFTATASASTWR